MIQLSKEQVIWLHDELLASSGGTTGVRDEGLLDSAIQAPFQSFDQRTCSLHTTKSGKACLWIGSKSRVCGRKQAYWSTFDVGVPWLKRHRSGVYTTGVGRYFHASGRWQINRERLAGVDIGTSINRCNSKLSNRNQFAHLFAQCGIKKIVL